MYFCRRLWFHSVAYEIRCTHNDVWIVVTKGFGTRLSVILLIISRFANKYQRIFQQRKNTTIAYSWAHNEFATPTDTCFQRPACWLITTYRGIRYWIVDQRKVSSLEVMTWWTVSTTHVCQSWRMPERNCKLPSNSLALILAVRCPSK